ncbi:MAG: stress response translation initiation inhibitor YciH [Actinobacteria bacterium]|nr:stress response translation initiation inhibitor YciH [Actinomycetota bacterium]
MTDSRLVYSTDSGDHRRRAGAENDAAPQVPADGIVRVFREKGGRGGKTVTVVRGLPAADLDAVGSELKRRCGTGGAVKVGTVELQGDHREKAAELLRAKGYRVKLAGG